MCIVTYRYQGGDAPEEDRVTYELDTSMAEKPIQTHPSFLTKLKDAYLWDEHTGEFAEELPSAKGGGGNSDGRIPFANSSGVMAGQMIGKFAQSTALSGGGGRGGKTMKNPLFGVQTWFSVSVVFRKSYAVPFDRVPGNLLKGIGTIVPAPEGIAGFHLPAGSAGRNWLKLAPRLSRRGNLVQIGEETGLSNPGGWKPQIYNFSQLDEDTPE